MTKDNSYQGYPVSIRAQVFKELDINQLLTAKHLAKLMNLPYKEYKQTLTNYRHQWLYTHENERGSKCSSTHRARYVGLVRLGEVNRAGAINKGWVLSRARNRFLIYRDVGLGRIAWFETGLLLLDVRKPANEGKAKQLFCNGFFRTGLITDVNVLNACVDRVHVHSGHTVFPTSQRLPKMTIDAFADSHGITIKLGDRSHPNSAEILWEVQREVEKMGNLAEGFVKFMDSFGKLVDSNANGANHVKPLGADYST